MWLTKNKSILFGILSILATIFIFNNSFKTATQSSAASGGIVDFIVNFFSQYGYILDSDMITVIVRKMAHIFEFSAQGIFISLSYHFGKFKFRSKYINVLFFGLLTAATDELIQDFVSGRGSLVQDIWIDFSGVILAVIFYLIISLSSKKF